MLQVVIDRFHKVATRQAQTCQNKFHGFILFLFPFLIAVVARLSIWTLHSRRELGRSLSCRPDNSALQKQQLLPTRFVHICHEECRLDGRE
jgi:hypothetical protein